MALVGCSGSAPLFPEQQRPLLAPWQVGGGGTQTEADTLASPTPTVPASPRASVDQPLSASPVPSPYQRRESINRGAGDWLDPLRQTLRVSGTARLSVTRPMGLAPTGDGRLIALPGIEGVAVSWTSLDPEVLEVAPDGTIRGLRLGTARVRAVGVLESDIDLSTEVRVAEAAPEPSPATSVSPSPSPSAAAARPASISGATGNWLDEARSVLEVGGTARLILTRPMGFSTLPDGRSIALPGIQIIEARWTSLTPDVLEVGPDGAIRGLSPGRGVVEAVAVREPDVTATRALRVEGPLLVDGPELTAPIRMLRVDAAPPPTSDGDPVAEHGGVR
jgi:hypothetical protein